MDRIFYDEIIDKIKSILEDKNINYTLLSEMTGMTVPTISLYMNKKRIMKVTTLIKIFRCLGYDLSIIERDRRYLYERLKNNNS